MDYGNLQHHVLYYEFTQGYFIVIEYTNQQLTKGRYYYGVSTLFPDPTTPDNSIFSWLTCSSEKKYGQPQPSWSQLVEREHYNDQHGCVDYARK